MIGVAAAMGFTPQQFDRMSMYEFRAARVGWEKAHASEDKDSAPSDAEDEALRRKYAEV